MESREKTCKCTVLKTDGVEEHPRTDLKLTEARCPLRGPCRKTKGIDAINLFVPGHRVI